MSGARKIKVGRDYFENIAGNAQVTTGASLEGDYANLVQTITPQSPKEDILKLFSHIQQQLAASSLPENVKSEAQNEIKGAEIQLKKNPPNQDGMVAKLKSAVAVIKTVSELGAEAVGLGNLIGKAIEWGGAKWLGLMG